MPFQFQTQRPPRKVRSSGGPDPRALLSDQTMPVRPAPLGNTPKRATEPVGRRRLQPCAPRTARGAPSPPWHTRRAARRARPSTSTGSTPVVADITTSREVRPCRGEAQKVERARSGTTRAAGRIVRPRPVELHQPGLRSRCAGLDDRPVSSRAFRSARAPEGPASAPLLTERAPERFQHPVHVDVPGASSPDVGPALTRRDGRGCLAPPPASRPPASPGPSGPAGPQWTGPSAIRRSFPKGRAQRGVETISELDVSIIFPFDGSASRRPLPSTGYPRSRPFGASRLPPYPGIPAAVVMAGRPRRGRPVLIEALRLPAALPAALRFFRLAVPRSLRLCSLPCTQARRTWAWGCSAGSPPALWGGDDRVSQVPGESPCVRAGRYNARRWSGADAPGPAL